MKLGLLVTLLLLATVGQAQVEPVVRVSIKPEIVAVGEPVILEISVLVPTWFPTPPIYPAFELSNAITRQPPDSSYPTNERINGETWAGIVREYQISPMLAATYQMADQSMTVTYADPQTRKPIKVQVAVPEISFQAVVPPGAAQIDPYLAGRSLELERVIEGDLDRLQAGDALVVQYTARLDGLPAIFLPPLVAFSAIPGLSVYADQPVIADEPLATRTERLTLVFESAGEFSLPAVELQWWNSVSERVEISTTPALKVTVAGPVGAQAGKFESTKSTWPLMASALTLALLLLLAWMRWSHPLRQGWRSHRERRLRSEQYAYARLRSALRSGEPRAVHTALMAWLKRLEPASEAREFARRHGNARLQANIEQLSQSLFFDLAEAVDLKGLQQALEIARRHYRFKRSGKQVPALPALNPR